MRFALLRAYLGLSRWGIFWWSVFVVIYGVLILYFYGFFSQVAGLQQLYQGLPEQLRTVMGASGDLSIMFSPEGTVVLDAWLAVEYISWWPILMGIYAVIYCGGSLPRDAEQGVLENLLSQPIRRAWLAMSRFLTFAAIIAIVGFLSWVGVVLGSVIFGHQMSFPWLAMAFAEASMATAAIAAYSLLVSTLFLDSRKAPAIAGGVLAAQYLINLVAPAVTSATWIQKLSLFYYFRPLEVMALHQANLHSLFLYGGVTAVCVAAALWVFEHRDISA